MSSLHPQVIEARTQLAEARIKAANLHASGATGPQVCFAWADSVDAIVLRLIRTSCEELAIDPSSFVFVAHGGYGRRDLAPFSDIDLMLLHRGLSEREISPLARKISQMIVDTGFQLGFSVRTPFQCRQIAWTDATILTSLVEMRFLHGSEPLFDRFQQSLRTGVKWRWRSLAAMIEKERFEERQKYGETEFLLHPNIKRSRGCLRDVQIVRWIGFVCFGEKSPEQLVDMGLLAPEDYQAIRDGYKYLLLIRNQLHFAAGRAQDSLDRSKQMEMAKWMGHQGTEGVLPVEEFMQNFFAKTSEVRYSSANFVGMARSRLTPFGFLSRFLCLPAGQHLRLGIKEVWATPTGLRRMQTDPAKVLELMQVANRYNRRIEHRTWRTIRQGMLRRPESPVGSEAIARFLKLLSEPGRLGEILRRLHELRVLEQIIPAMRHARSLLQFNEYHKYTVDAHCIRSVECAGAFAKRSDFLGPLYRGLKNKMILHLSLLLHDLGKGFTEDHSEVGKTIAEETAEKLKLSDSDRELVVFLVHQHLLMTHTAFRFDLTQKSTIIRFALQVGSLERLKLLTILSCADLDAVGPGAMNEWKLNLIHELYVATEAQLRTGNVPGQESQQHATLRSAIMAQRTIQEREDPWWSEQIASVPTNYLTHLKPKDLAEELRRIQRLSSQRPADAWATYLADQNATEYVVAVHPDRSAGLFHRVTGALTSKGVSILSADIHTQPGPIAWDRFVVDDMDYNGAPPPHRLAEVCEAIVSAIVHEESKPPLFRRTWKSKSTSDAAIARTQPTQIRFDNSSSDDFTIITVFAYDRTGLLYDISRTLFDFQLDLQVAKVSTHLDQVVDVFYVTDFDGNKVTEATRLYTLRQKLLRAIEKQQIDQQQVD
ncbi:MAG: [protein-PII] uridylyltransferase [Planctomycetota bacterium]